MTRVVHVVVAGEIGGAERMLVDLASDKPSHSVALLTPNRALASVLSNAGLRVHNFGSAAEGPLPFLRTSLGRRHVAWLAGVLVREGAAVVHLHTFASQVLGTRAALRAGAQVLRTEHSTRVYDNPTCWPFSRWSLRRAHASAAISEHVRARALERAPWASGKMRVIYNGVDTDRFTPAAASGVVAPWDFRFALVGRLEPRKGVDLAIDALAQVPDVRLDIVGDGPERAALWRRATERGVASRVVFHGYQGDTRPVVARASAALCSSRREGLGIAVLEAMAMGKAVVAFGTGGVAELVDHGRTGLVAEPGDVWALAACMRAAVAAGPKRFAWGGAGRAVVVDRFSMLGMRKAYEAIYDELSA